MIAIVCIIGVVVRNVYNKFLFLIVFVCFLRHREILLKLTDLDVKNPLWQYRCDVSGVHLTNAHEYLPTLYIMKEHIALKNLSAVLLNLADFTIIGTLNVLCCCVFFHAIIMPNVSYRCLFLSLFHRVTQTPDARKSNKLR